MIERDDDPRDKEDEATETAADAEVETAPESPSDAEPAEGAEPVVQPLSEVDRLENELEGASARLRSVSKAYTELQAEMQSFRERLETQARFKAERQSFELARTFFDPVQNLKRSLAGAEDGAGLVEGVEMVLHQFMEALKKLGLEEIPGTGADFDPRWHEALAITPVADAEQDGKVLMVHADGYTVNGRVLQAAQVVVGKHQVRDESEHADG